LGSNTTANARYSFVAGLNTYTSSYASFVIGRYNSGGGNPTTWLDTDPLFEIGNGSDGSNRNNALTVLKNGNVGIGTSEPDEQLHISGNMRIDGTFEDMDGNAGSAGQILSSTGTGTEWITALSGGDFSNGGEAGGADRSLGNTDNYALSFKTANAPRLKIQNDGGIRIDGNLGLFTDPDDISNINKSIKIYASGIYSNPNVNISGHNSANIYLESRRQGFTSETSGKKWYISSGSGSVLDLDKFTINNTDDGNCFTIRDGGNIGIGTQEPVEKLHVAGSMKLEGTFGDKNGNTGSSGQILSSTGTGTEWITALSGGDFSNGGEAGGADRTLGNSDNYDLGFKTNNQTRFQIDENGKIGIGTTNPHGQFEVFGYNPGVNTTVGDFVVDTENKKIYVGRLSTTPYNSSDFIVRNRLGYQTFVVSAANYISMGNYNGSQEQMRVVFDGNTFGVGIGTTTPKSKLQVNGGVQIANDSNAASADKAGTLRYRADSNNSYVEMCMQTGASSYAWVVVKQNSW